MRIRGLLAPGKPLVAGFAVMLAAETLVFVRGHSQTIAQPVAYNHSKHLAAGLTCTDCHTGAKTAEHATLPQIAFCMSCHETALTQSAEEGKLRAIGAAGMELAWQQVTRVPAHVYFSHRRHAGIGRIECATCHGDMSKVTSPPQRPFKPVTMDGCIGCHERNGARTDCNDCHR
jgi:hypothetical protein